MADANTTIEVDALGEICPDPLLKATAAMKRAAQDQAVQLLTDFPPAVLVVTNAAVGAGWDVVIRRRAAEEWSLLLTRSAFAS